MSRQITPLPVGPFSMEEFLNNTNARPVSAWRGRDSHVHLRESGDAAELSDALFDRFEARMDARVAQSPVDTEHMDLVLLHGKNPGLAPVFDRIGDEFQSLDVYNSKALAFRTASQSVGHKTVFAIDIDALGHVDKAVPKLMHLRRLNPMLTVVIMSAHFNRDDLSGERQAIADASIRLPANASGLLRGIGQAVHNVRRRQGL